MLRRDQGSTGYPRMDYPKGGEGESPGFLGIFYAENVRGLSAHVILRALTGGGKGKSGEKGKK